MCNIKFCLSFIILSTIISLKKTSTSVNGLQVEFKVKHIFSTV